MLLAIDIGNTTVTFGIFEGDELVSTYAIPTLRNFRANEIFAAAGHGLDKKITNIIISSVVPELEKPFRKFARNYLDLVPVFVDHSFDFGFSIDYYPPESCGSDRLVAAKAAVNKYGNPCIICDFGTATTIDVVNSKLRYLGGVIVPGVKTLSDSLFEKTSKLPNIEIEKPEKVIGNTTAGSIRSGIYHGYIGLVDGLIGKMIEELDEKPTIIATGGYSSLIAEGSVLIEFIDRNLILEGLALIQQEIDRANSKIA